MSDLLSDKEVEEMLKNSPSPTVNIETDEKPVVETEESDLLSDEEVEQQLKASPPLKKLPSKIIKEEEIISDEKPSVPTSLRELEKDEEFFQDILQYRKDRFKIEKDKGSYNFLTGFFTGDTQELTQENLIDDYLDHYRGITNNSVVATSEINWLEGLKAQEDALLKKGENNLNTREIDALNNLREQRARALRIYKKADNLAGVFNTDRYKDMSFVESVGDGLSTVGVHIMHALGDPITIFTAGIGKLIGTTAQTVGVTPFKSAIIAAASTAPLEGGASALVDVQVQKAEIEMGARKTIDYERVATVAGISSLTAGTIAGVGTRNAAVRVEKASRGKLTNALKSATELQEKAAEKTNKKLGVQSNEIREKLAKGISDIYGKNVIIRNKSGKITGLNSKIIRESDKATALKKRLESDLVKEDPKGLKPFSDTDIESSLSFGTFERVIAGASEIFEAAKAGKIKFIDATTQKEIKEFGAKLQKNEMVSERLLNILSNTSEESLDFTASILGKYGITQRELAASLFADASWAGKRLQRLSALSKVVGRASRVQTATEAAETAENVAASKFGSTFRKLEDIRRLTLVSGVATAVRNNISQVIRSGVDTLVYGLETGLHSIAGTGRKKFGFRDTLAQLEHTFYNSKDADGVAKFLLELSDSQKQRFYNQYSEVRATISKKNPGQASTAKLKDGISSETPVLDRWESVVHTANVLNRYQEFLYRNGMFTASIQRQLYSKVATKSDIDTLAKSLSKSQGMTIEQAKNSLKTVEGKSIDMFDVLNSGEVTRYIDEGMLTKAVDDSLDFTYASQPKLPWFKTWNQFIVQSGLTLAIPFPRFMFKALEMTYNYNVTGAATGLLRMGLAKAGGKEITDGAYRQLAEGIAGGMPLIALGYYLRDRDGETAGTEWYNLKDGLGNEFDARPFFPLTPYLLIGEVLHRIQEERPGKVVDFMKEVVPGFTGANFRGSGAAGAFLEDLLASGTTAGDPMAFTVGAKEVGKYFGEALSGYGQPIYQFADMFTTSDQRMKDYKDDPKYREGISGFFASAGEGFIQPFVSRLSRVAEAAGFDIDEPYKEDPRFEQVPERVMPFMKILFGATLTRVPPKYVSDLNSFGFSYVDFMSRTNSANLDRMLNREMGIAMQTEMPELLATLTEEYGDKKAAKAQEIKKYISTMKSMLYADLKISGEDDSGLKAELGRFRKLGPYGRQAAIEAFKTVYKTDPNFNEYQDVAALLDFGKNNFSTMSKQRKNM